MHTDAQVEQAINRMEKILDAAKNSNHAGELLLIEADAAGDMRRALEAWFEHRRIVFHAQMMGELDTVPIGRIDEIVDQAQEALKKAKGE